MHRQLLAFANKFVLLPAPFQPKITFKEPYSAQMQMMILPHELFSSLYHSYKEAWKSIMVPCATQISEFWTLQQQHMAFADHPVLTGNPSFRQKMVPLALHGDGTPCTGIGKIWCRQLTTWSWNSLLGTGTTKSMQLQIWAAFDETMHSSTLPEFWAILGWSFKWLQLGKWPTEDHKGNKYPVNSEAGKKGGTELADGYCGLLWSLVGDLEYLTQVLKLPHYSSKSSPCSLCRCKGDSSANSWKDCRLVAPWLGMLWKPADWNNWEHRSTCDLFKQLPGLTAVATCYDFMHSKYLGTDMVFLASCLWLLCHKILPHHLPLENLKLCWEKINATYKEKKITDRYRGMTKLSLFQRKRGGPKLKGRASQVASLAVPMLELWQFYMDPEVLAHRHVKAWLKMNVLTEKMKANEQELALGPEDYNNFKTWSFAMAQLHLSLSQQFADEEVTLFAGIPKIHTWLHSVHHSNVINPRLTWCFRQEDYMAIQRTLAKSCCKGLKGPQVTGKIINKVRVAMHIHLKNL